jgi:hypothetical protein
VTLTAEELLAGSRLTFDIQVPDDILHLGDGASAGPATPSVRLRPLSVCDLQLISHAAKESDSLVATLMVQRSLVEPPMTVAQVAMLPIGLMQFLLLHVNEISGITTTPQALDRAVEQPLAKAAFVLAKEFGWTPQQVNELTFGQILLHLQMLKDNART